MEDLTSTMYFVSYKVYCKILYLITRIDEEMKNDVPRTRY